MTASEKLQRSQCSGAISICFTIYVLACPPSELNTVCSDPQPKGKLFYNDTAATATLTLAGYLLQPHSLQLAIF